MTMTDKLNEVRATEKLAAKILEYRAAADTGTAAVRTCLADLTRIAADADFAGVDAEIKNAGGAIKTIFKATATALEAHAEFTDYRPAAQG